MTFIQKILEQNNQSFSLQRVNLKMRIHCHMFRVDIRFHGSQVFQNQRTVGGTRRANLLTICLNSFTKDIENNKTNPTTLIPSCLYYEKHVFSCPATLRLPSVNVVIQSHVFNANLHAVTPRYQQSTLTEGERGPVSQVYAV